MKQSKDVEMDINQKFKKRQISNSNNNAFLRMFFYITLSLRF